MPTLRRVARLARLARCVTDEDQRVRARESLLGMTLGALRGAGMSVDAWEQLVRDHFPHLLERVGEQGFEAMVQIALRGVRGERRRR